MLGVLQTQMLVVHLVVAVGARLRPTNKIYCDGPIMGARLPVACLLPLLLRSEKRGFWSHQADGPRSLGSWSPSMTTAERGSMDMFRECTEDRSGSYIDLPLGGLHSSGIVCYCFGFQLVAAWAAFCPIAPTLVAPESREDGLPTRRSRGSGGTMFRRRETVVEHSDQLARSRMSALWRAPCGGPQICGPCVPG